MPACPSCGQANPEGARFCNACGAPLEAAPAAREQRKTVTVLFCDVTGSTALGESTDPEALRAVLARYFERMKGIVESHGGTVEKFIGDAVMAVFGVPQVHEDDALRACRAAVEMRDALPELGVQARIGVNTGEVVTGTEERLATGDAVNVAARLEQAAQPGEILIGDETLALVRDAVEAEAGRAARAEGKGTAGRRPPARWPCARLPSARHETPLRRARERELEAPSRAWNRAVRGGSAASSSPCSGCRRRQVAARRRVRSPTLERARRARALPLLRTRDHLLARRRGREAARVRGRPMRAAAAAIGSLLGETDAATSPDEIAWAFRKLLEAEAPLACVFDDVHWAEETLLDLVDHVALLSSRRADSARLHGQAGAARASAAVARDGATGAARRGERRVPDPGHHRGGAAGPDRSRLRRQPALRPGDGRDGFREQRRGRRAPDAAGAPRTLASTSSTGPSGRSSSAALSRARSFTAARYRRCRMRAR